MRLWKNGRGKMAGSSADDLKSASPVKLGWLAGVATILFLGAVSWILFGWAILTLIFG
jgi:hypothetical protein